jgi:DNA-binding transcriptional LysR family regulator
MDYFNAARAFTRVVETGSFVNAAASLHMPRNTVTKLVQALEVHLRTKLLNRTTRRVSLTNDGAAYYERISRLVEEWQEVEAELAHAQASPRGRLRVDMASATATLLVIPALPAFQQRYPDLQLDIGVSDRPSDFISDRVDCVVRSGKITDPSLIARHLGDFPFVTCATPSYLERNGIPAHPSELEEGHTLVKYFFASGRHLPIVLSSGDQEYTARGRQFVAVNDGNALLAAGLAGLGIVHLPAFLALPQINAGLLQPVLEEWQAEAVPISIVYAPNRHLSTRVRVFVDWLIELFRTHPHLR